MAVNKILLNRLQQLEKRTGIKPNTKKHLTDMALLNLLNDFEIYDNKPDKLKDFISALESGLNYISEKDVLENRRREIYKKKLELY